MHPIFKRHIFIYELIAMTAYVVSLPYSFTFYLSSFMVTETCLILEIPVACLTVKVWIWLPFGLQNVQATFKD
jgi:hypothetical protein